jgi:hypothetical protein
VRATERPFSRNTYTMTRGGSSSARSCRERERLEEALKVQALRKRNTACRRRNRALERIRSYNVSSIAASVDNLECLELASINRAAAAHAKRLAFALAEETGKRGLQYQRVVLKKLLEQPTLREALPDFVSQKRELEDCRVVCDGLADAWSGLKYGIGRDRYLARNVIEAAVISIGDDRCMRAAGRCIGMNRRTLRRAKQRRDLLNKRSDGEVWARIYRKRRKDAVDQSVVDLTVAWWTDETRVSPCKKDVRWKRIGFKKRISHCTHWLEESQVSSQILERCLIITIFVILGLFWHFETVTNIRTWIK